MDTDSKLTDQEQKKFEAIQIMIIAHKSRLTDPKSAKEYYGEAIELFKQAKNINGVIECMIGLGHLERVQKNIELASKAFKNALKDVKNLESGRDKAVLEGNATKGLADLEAQIAFQNPESEENHLKMAEELYKKVYRLYKKVDDKLGMANVHHRLGLVQTRIGLLEHHKLPILEQMKSSNASIENAIRHYESASILFNEVNMLNEAAKNEKLVRILPKLLVYDHDALNEFLRIMKSGDIQIE